MRQSRHPCPIVRHGAWLAANSQPARTITGHRIGAARVASAGVVAGFASSKSREPTSAMAVNEPGLGSSADGKGEEGVDRSFERTATPMYLGE